MRTILRTNSVGGLVARSYLKSAAQNAATRSVTAGLSGARSDCHSQLAVMAADSAELDGLEPPEPDDPDALEQRTSQLVADLVEPAKSTALEKLGEGRQAFDIANAWLRAKLGVAEAASL